MPGGNPVLVPGLFFRLKTKSVNHLSANQGGSLLVHMPVVHLAAQISGNPSGHLFDLPEIRRGLSGRIQKFRCKLGTSVGLPHNAFFLNPHCRRKDNRGEPGGLGGIDITDHRKGLIHGLSVFCCIWQALAGIGRIDPDSLDFFVSEVHKHLDGMGRWFGWQLCNRHPPDVGYLFTMFCIGDGTMAGQEMGQAALFACAAAGIGLSGERESVTAWFADLAGQQVEVGYLAVEMDAHGALVDSHGPDAHGRAPFLGKHPGRFSDIRSRGLNHISDFFRRVILKKFRIVGKIGELTFRLQTMPERTIFEVLRVHEILRHDNLCHGIQEIHIIAGLKFQMEISVACRWRIAWIGHYDKYLVRIRCFPVNDPPEQHGMVFRHIGADDKKHLAEFKIIVPAARLISAKGVQIAANSRSHTQAGISFNIGCSDDSLEQFICGKCLLGRILAGAIPGDCVRPMLLYK